MIEDAKNYLKAELARRKEINPLFSLRAFARILDISPAQLSQILSGKRHLTTGTATKLAQALKLSPMEKEKFLESANPDAVKKKRRRLCDHERKKLLEDEFRLICDWKHFAILSLSEIEGHKSDIKWIAKKLNISVQDAAGAIERLLRMKLIEIKKSKIKQIVAPLMTTNDIKSDSIRRSHHQNLLLAQEKLDSVDISKREFTTITMASDAQKIKEAKKMIREFKRELMEFLEEGEKTEVYTLAIQLFPLTT